MAAGVDRLDFRLLGPLEVVEDDRALALPAGKPRAVLALLALHAGEPVSADRLIDAIWGERPPATAANALQGYVSQLRKAIGDDRGRAWPLLATEAGGYRLRIGPEQLDLHRFERLAAEGQVALRQGNAEVAGAKLREALSLWRGPPLADFTYEPFAQAAIARLEELRHATLEERIDADLAAGGHSELIAELETLAHEHPLRERLRGQLMLALYRAGRQADALAVYQQTRQLLIHELGIEPNPALQRLEKEILTQEPSLELRRAEPRRLPTGQVTLVFTDIEGSTRLLREAGDSYPELLARLRQLVRTAFRGFGGHEVDAHGDCLFFAFEKAADAVAAVATGHRAIAGEPWPGGREVKIRVGIHSGEPAVIDQAYVGLDVHRAARVCAAAHGGQTLVTGATRELLSYATPKEVHLRDLGVHGLRDLSDPEHLFQLEIYGLPSEFPPLRTHSAAEPARSPDRSILAVPHDLSQLSELAGLGKLLSRSRQPHELIVLGLLRSSDEGRAADELGETVSRLRQTREELSADGVAARIAAFTSDDWAADVLRFASRPEVDLLLIGADTSTLQDGSLREELASVLTEAPSDVGLWAQGKRPKESTGTLPARVVVPFGGGEHDWAALETGAWITAGEMLPLVLLGTAADTKAGRRDASRLLADAALLIQRASNVVAEPVLVAPGRDGIAGVVEKDDLLVIGFSDRWTQEGLGALRWALARTVDAPILFVRRGLRPGGLAPAASTTRFTWSVTGK